MDVRLALPRAELPPARQPPPAHGAAGYGDGRSFEEAYGSGGLQGAAAAYAQMQAFMAAAQGGEPAEAGGGWGGQGGMYGSMYAPGGYAHSHTAAPGDYSQGPPLPGGPRYALPVALPLGGHYGGHAELYGLERAPPELRSALQAQYSAAYAHAAAAHQAYGSGMMSGGHPGGPSGEGLPQPRALPEGPPPLPPPNGLADGGAAAALGRLSLGAEQAAAPGQG